MSDEDLLKQAPLVAPVDSDEQFIARLEYEDPVRKASIWLHKLIIHRLRDVELAAPWYLDRTGEPPARLVSDLFNQTDGRLCVRFGYFCRMIKKYQQGEVPSSVIEDDHRAVRILIATLSKLTENAETLRLLDRRIREFVRCVTAHDGARMLRGDYIRRIDSLAESIVTISGRVSDEFLRIEKIRRGEISEPATRADVKSVADAAKGVNLKADALLVSAGETLAAVKRIDRRGKKENHRRRFTVEQQEQCFRYWEVGRRNAAVKENTTGKVRYGHVFAYFRKELRSIGVRSEDAFKAALLSRSKRISKAQRK